MKILVTGANGYIGNHVVKTLLDKGNEVIAVDFKSDSIDNRAIIHSYNIFEDKESLIKDLKIVDTVLHLAWQDGFVHNSENHIKNLPAHYEFIKTCIDNDIKHIAVMGTMHEVGYHEGKIDENTPTNPLSMYGIAKNSLRQCCQTLKTNNPDVCFQWIRAFYILGDDEKNNSIFAKILKAEKEGKTEFPFTSGENQYDFMDITELSEQITQVVMQTTVNGIINCCTGIPVRLKDKVEEFLKQKNLKIKLAYGKYPDRAYDSPIIYGDNTKIKQIQNNKK